MLNLKIYKYLIITILIINILLFYKKVNLVTKKIFFSMAIIKLK